MNNKYVKLFYSIKPLIRSIGPNEDDMQEALIKIIKADPVFNGRKNSEIKNYMITAAVSCQIDRIRSTYNRKNISTDFESGLKFNEPVNFNTYMEVIEDEHYWESVYRRFDNIYERLSEDQKLYVLMRFFRNMSGKEISEITGDTIPIIKAKMFKMKKSILRRHGKI